MGLDTSHDCFSGACSTFHSLRVEWAKALKIPPLDLMEGFYSSNINVMPNPFWFLSLPENKERLELLKYQVLDYLPIKWEALKPNPIYKLLCHSDCDGEIKADDCLPIAESLEKILPKLKDGYNGHIWDCKEATQKWIDGLKSASKNKENVEFH
jgi:hypothetical protein